jgi:4-aminobutyrate aminotransferase-like enzyme
MNVMWSTWFLLWWKPVAAAAAVAALEVVREEKLSENAERLGIILRKD